MNEDDWNFSENSPHWRCEECSATPDMPPPQEKDRGKQPRKCPKCKSVSLMPVGL